jgi:cell wall-associated NlpC family hydrolase
MNHRLRLRAAVFAALALAAAASLLAAPAAAASDDPAAVAAAYLRARTAAVASRHPSTVLAPFVVPGSPLALRERWVARGTAMRQADLGHIVDGVACDVAVGSVGPTGVSPVIVAAHVITTVSWHAAGGSSTEATGVDHILTLAPTGAGWRVTADAYVDVEQPALLERAGAPAARVHLAGDRLEAAAAAARAVQAVAVSRDATPPAEAAPATLPATRGYADRLVYDRDAVRAYADRYALTYNPTYARFTGDCCNFVSQGAFAGGMPVALGDWTTGWWYDKQGTGSPSDDAYSWSWISCSRQTSFWVGTRIDWVSGIAGVGKGDVVYYDWTGDGSWDHVAVLAGTNSAGQKVVDAHTTDHYRVFWKLGTSSTRYRFGRVRAAWVV